MQTLSISDEGAVRTVTLDRPEALNAFSAELMDELCDAFLDTTSDQNIKVLIVTGAGRAFSAGADLAEMGRSTYTPRHGFAAMLDAIIDFPKPMIVAVNGLGVGIGATICGLADMTYIAEGARLRCPFSALGLTAEAGSTLTLPLLMGRQRASWFLLAAEWMDAQACVEAGLALEVWPKEKFDELVMQKAQTLAALPLSSLETTKALMTAPFKEQLRASIKAENEGLAALVGSPGNKEALAAFREKREPDFAEL